MQAVLGAMTMILTIIRQACGGTSSWAALDALNPARLGTRQFWQQMQAEVAAPLAAALAAEERRRAERGAAGGGRGRGAGHPALRPPLLQHDRAGARGRHAARQALRGCRLVRYCGAACQKADWQAHKAACRELQRREQGEAGA